MLNFNKNVINENMKFKEYDQQDRKRINEERMRELNNLKTLEMNDKMYNQYRQRKYKEILDDQMVGANSNLINVINAPNILSKSQVNTRARSDVITNPCKLL